MWVELSENKATVRFFEISSYMGAQKIFSTKWSENILRDKQGEVRCFVNFLEMNPFTNDLILHIEN